MRRDTVITIIIILLGFVTFLIGIVLGEAILNIIGGIMIILPPIILNIKKKEERKSLIHYVESEYQPILSTKETRVRFQIKEYWKKIRGFFEKAIIMIFIAAITLGLATILMTRYIFKPTHLTAETAIIDGCSVFGRGGCKGDPSKIVINYDVNGDGIVGGFDDNLLNLLKIYNCTDNCIKRRCGCVGY